MNPRMTVTVPIELRQRMRKLSRNWSQVARDAFLRELNPRHVTTGPANPPEWGSRLPADRVCVFDIETVPDAAALDDPEFERIARSKITPPSNYKNPEKIAEYVSEKWQERRAKAALDPLVGRIVAIGHASAAGGDVACEVELDDERSVIERFLDALDRGRFRALAGFNIRDFDVPFVSIRAALHGIEMPHWWPRPTRDWKRIVELRDALSSHPLQVWLARFGLPLKTSSGDQVEHMTADEVAAYCANDVEQERALVRRFASILEPRIQL
jgi:DNA polymerase elongation subunit (family B)